MKKLLSILFALISFASFGQTVRAIQGYNPTTMQPGVIYRDTTIALPYTPGKYITGYATVGSLPDSAMGYFSGTSPILYNSTTGVISSQLFSSTLNGYVPLSGGGTANFLRADGTWAAAGGGGSGWGLTGNSATDSSLNFLGTTDNRRMQLRQNNILRGYLGNTGLILNGFDVTVTPGEELPLNLISKISSNDVGISLKQTGGSGAEYRIKSTNTGNLVMGWYNTGLNQTFASITLGTYGSLSIGNCTAVSLQSNNYLGAYGAATTIDKRGLTFSLENSSANTLINSSGSASYLAAIPMAIRALSLSVNSTGSVANTSSIADFSSTTQGLLPPRMTNTQKTAIGSPVAGLTVYCTDCTATDASTGVMQTYNGSTWKNNW
jgi:hypothetical protein